VQQLQLIVGAPGCATLGDWLAGAVGAGRSDIVAAELSFVDAQAGAAVGGLLAAQRLDNQAACFAALKALTQSTPAGHACVVAVFDNEEIGSQTRAGARGTLLADFLERLIPDARERHPFVARSLFVNDDSAHGFHPNYAGAFDGRNLARVGQGTALKRSAGTAFATDCVSAIPLKLAAKAAGKPLQHYMARNGGAGGSTIAPYIATQLGIPTVDIGIPQWAMHSIRETASFQDVKDHTAILAEVFTNYPKYRVT
jgi:aspartyl aminopeptidase